jgi:hypothetical protein
MGILSAFFRGLGLSLVKGKLVIFLYAVNLLFALVLAAPMLHVVSDELAHSTSAPALETSFDAAAVLDLLGGDREMLAGVRSGFLYAALLYVLIATFLSGGVLECLHHRHERVSLAFFFLGCGRYVFRFLRLLILAAIVFLALVLVNGYGNAILGLVFEGTSNEVLAQIVLWAKTAVLLFLFLLFLMILNYARIRIVVEGRRSVIGAFLGGIRFWLGYPLRTTGLYFLYLMLGWGLLALYHYVANSAIEPEEFYGLLAIQQGYLFLRMGVRVAGQGAQVELFKSLGVDKVDPHPVRPPIEPPPKEEPREPIRLSSGPPPPPDVPAPREPESEE